MVIFIAGQVGVGKTTLARALSKKLGVFHYELGERKSFCLILAVEDRDKGN